MPQNVEIVAQEIFSGNPSKMLVPHLPMYCKQNNMQSNTTLGHIHRKIDEIQSGLLRFQDNDVQVTLHVRVKSSGTDSIDCLLKEKADVKKLKNGRVSLIQKSDKNYLYISGELEQQPSRNTKGISISVLRACWFILKSKGSVSWLQDKYIYDISSGTQLELAS